MERPDLGNRCTFAGTVGSNPNLSAIGLNNDPAAVIAGMLRRVWRIFRLLYATTCCTNLYNLYYN